MNEIALQIIELGKLIGKKVYVKHYVEEYNTYFSDSVDANVFTIADFEYYAYGLLYGEIELIDINYKPKFGKYYLVTFKDL